MIAEATFRQQVKYVEDQTIHNLDENNSKVIKKFVEYSQEIGFENQI